MTSRAVKVKGPLDANDLFEAWCRADSDVERHRKARNAETCEDEYRGSNAPDDPSVPACWQEASEDIADWCEPCIRSRQHQAELVKARRRLRTVVGQMRRFVLSSRPAPEEK